MTSAIPTKHAFRDESRYDDEVFHVSAETRSEAVRLARSEARDEGYVPIRTKDVQAFDGHGW